MTRFFLNLHIEINLFGKKVNVNLSIVSFNSEFTLHRFEYFIRPVWIF